MDVAVVVVAVVAIDLSLLSSNIFESIVCWFCLCSAGG